MKLLVLICLIGIALGGAAQTTSDSLNVMQFRIFYPVGAVDLHEDYMDNANTLHHIRKYLEKSPQIDRITIYSYASPEGSYQLNKHLAVERGKTAKRYLLESLPSDRYLPESMIILDPTAENWEGLRNLVYYLYALDDKEAVLAILDRTDITNEQRKVLLKRLNRGQSWAYILKELMPQLRYATWISVWQRIEVDRIEKAPVCLALDLPKLEPIHPLPKVEVSQEKTLLALKTNLLYDAVTALNVEVEVPIGDKWSVAVEDVFPWWHIGNKYAFQMWEIGVEGRYWFHRTPARKVLSGQFLGIYTMSAKYDFQWRTHLNYQGEYWSTGLTYGYAKPIGKYFNLELSLSLGYLSTAYRHYMPSPGYTELHRDPDKQGRLGYWGPTKIKASLVCPINISSRKKKGGRL